MNSQGGPDESSEDYSDVPSHVYTKEELLSHEFSERLKESFPRSSSYDSVSALLIYWCKDNLGCESEVIQLRDFWRQRFNYEANELKLPARDADMVLRAQIDLLVVKLNSDGKRNLLIVYYGGHGKADGPRRGSVWCADDSPGSPSLQWDKIQPQLERADGDVLLIIDSCHAAQAARDGKPHKIELLAASAMNVQTPCAGDGSFTAALMAEMERLLETHKDGFSVSQLQSHLIGIPAGLQETPIYSDLSRNKQPSITLQPLPRPGEIRNTLTPQPRATVTLSISLRDPLDKDHVQVITGWLKSSTPCTVLNIEVEKITNDIIPDEPSSGSAPVSVSPEWESDSESSFDGGFEEVRGTPEEYYEGPWVGVDKGK